MRIKQNGNKRDLVAVTVYNDEASSTINLGNAVVLSLSGTQDGLGVVLPATAAAKKATSLGFGVSMGSYTAKGYGEAQVFGLCSNTMLLRTRAASTDPFVSIDVGAVLIVETVSNAFISGATVGVSAYAPNAVLASSLAAVASTTASTATGFTSQCVAFLRMM